MAGENSQVLGAKLILGQFRTFQTLLLTCTRNGFGSRLAMGLSHLARKLSKFPQAIGFLMMKEDLE